MNKTIIKDKFWNIWFKLPKCKKHRKELHDKARKEINKDLIKDASIVATNCIGGEISNALGFRFNSPFVNMTMPRNDFVTLCSHFREYMMCEPEIMEGDYPTVYLGGDGLEKVMIRYIHDTDKDKVYNDFMKRRERINYDKLIFITDDQGLDDAHLEIFDNIDCFRKVCLTSSEDKERKFRSCHLMPEYRGMSHVGMYQGKDRSGVHRFENTWDYVGFLNGGNN